MKPHAGLEENSLFMKNILIIVLFFTLVLGYLAFFWDGKMPTIPARSVSSSIDMNDPLYAKFQALSTKGNSSCSGTFTDSISSMKDGDRLQGSCCSPMNWHRYKEQVEGLKKYSNIKEIPSDPYDIDSNLAKKMKSYYDKQLTKEQQGAYDYAMQNSNEKGPCCCKCWRWYVYGGLAKFLIAEKGFSGEQITEVWNLSDGCGGEGDHVNHTS